MIGRMSRLNEIGDGGVDATPSSGADNNAPNRTGRIMMEGKTVPGECLQNQREQKLKEAIPAGA